MKRIIILTTLTFLLAFTMFAVAHADDNVTYEDVLAALQAYYAGLISKEDADAVYNQYLGGQDDNSGDSGSVSSTATVPPVVSTPSGSVAKNISTPPPNQSSLFATAVALATAAAADETSSSGASGSSTRNVGNTLYATPIQLATALATTAPAATRTATGNLKQLGQSDKCGGQSRPGVRLDESSVGWLCNGRQWVKVQYSTPVPASAIVWDTPTPIQHYCSPSRTGTYPNGERIQQSGNPNQNAAACAQAKADVAATAAALAGN